MDLFEAIEKRYSYRGRFTNKPVSEDDLRKIVQAGLDAPTGKNMQTTEFVIINDEEKVKEIRNILPDKMAVATGKAYIACIVDKEPEIVFGTHHFQIEDCAAAVENMLLAITALGYTSVWLDGVLRTNNTAEKFAEIIKCPESKKVQIVLPVGKPEKEGARKEKKKFSERVKMNSY